jgi:hypothetical protein
VPAGVAGDRWKEIEAGQRLKLHGLRATRQFGTPIDGLLRPSQPQALSAPAAGSGGAASAAMPGVNLAVVGWAPHQLQAHQTQRIRAFDSMMAAQAYVFCHPFALGNHLRPATGLIIPYAAGRAGVHVLPLSKPSIHVYNLSYQAISLLLNTMSILHTPSCAGLGWRGRPMQPTSFWLL